MLGGGLSATQFGPLLTDRGVTFRLWAPAAREVDLVLERRIPMRKDGEWFVLEVPQAGTGTCYRFRIDDDIEIADPASHFQPEDVHGPSEVIDHAYHWQCPNWKGRPWSDAVFLEAHVGTFTREGTFRSMMERLDHLAATGVTAVELMPVSDFPGRWNWGYDGVLLFAPDSRYGRPEGLKALIDAAHARGLMVFLDVVYNHFGPEGNYLGRIAPQFFSDAQTPWGGAVNYRVPEVRGFMIEHALHWVREYRFDGLRLDAVHAIVTRDEPDILIELSRAVGKFAQASGRQIHLVLENDDNSASLLAPDQDPPAGRYRAQWNDDYHHAWHVLLTGEGQSYYRDYGHTRHIVRSLSQGFAYQGEPSRHRGGRPRGEPSRHLPPVAFVNYLQNHDQIGNRPLGERLTVLAKPDALAAALSVLLLQPSPPLLFMGEEWGATEPFPFFCDFKAELAEAVRNGRKRELAEAYAHHCNEIPDPISPGTRASAVLDWEATARPEHARRLELTRSLLEVRKRAIVPLLATIRDSEVSFDDGVLSGRWQSGSKSLKLLANLTDVALRREAINWGEPIWGGEPARELPPWSVYAAIGDA
jgi:maltooligosyltrehalose trehalohydrolase